MHPIVERLRSYIKSFAEKYNCSESERPIFEIVLFEHPCKELVFEKDGKQLPSGYPDANLNNMGFYYELDAAVEAMHENRCDIRETVFQAGFILCRFPGLYYAVTSDSRIYYLWDNEKNGFYESEEPELFKHVAY